MEEAQNVRLVRCPKCENLLPELPDISVYQCGGCGAVLRAKRRDPLEEDGVLETSDEENGRRVSEEVDGSVGLSSMETNGIEVDKKSKREKSDNVVLDGGSASSRVDSRGVLEDYDGSRRGRERERLDSGADQDRKARPKEGGNQHPSNGVNDNRGRAMKSVRAENKVEEARPMAASVRTRLTEPRVNPHRFAAQGRFAIVPDPDAGSSNHVRGSHYRYGDGSDGLARVKNLENDRAELLRKLDELTDKLTRSSDTTENLRERTHHEHHVTPLLPPDAYDRPDSFKSSGTRFSYGVNHQFLAPDHDPRVPYVPHNHAYGPYMDRHAMPFQEPYHPKNLSYEYGGFPDVYQGQMMGRPSYQPPNRYHPESSYQHIAGRHVDLNQDLFTSHPHETFFHQTTCSCLHCLDMNRQASTKIQPSRIASLNAHQEYVNRGMYQNVNPPAYDRQGFISDPPKSHDSKLIARSSSDLDRERVGFGHIRPKNSMADYGGRRILYPVVGGAPFLTCCNCFDLLKLPRSLVLIQKSQSKLKCGACSSILLLEYDGKEMVISVPERSDQVFAKVATSDSDDVPNENFETSQLYQDTGVINDYDPYENIDYSFKQTDPGPFLSSGEQKSNLDASQMGQFHNTSSSSSSEDELSPDSVIVRKEVSVPELSKEEKSQPPEDSPSQEYSDHYSEEVMHLSSQGNISKRRDQDRNIKEGKNFRQSSLKESGMATETDVSYNDHLGVSHDSTDTSKGEDRLPRSNKGSESFFAGLFKRRGFRDFSKSSKVTENKKLHVSVNGLCLADGAIKKAEKLSGPIQSGDYWYDSRAGFWGVMGYPCLGIIPPNIEEFNYPMPTNCAGGNTEVFVNGRELNQKDLDLLSSRGLPTARHKFYLVEMSGRVVDEDTGEELDGLGKLAPTVEKAKHGFGMKTPRSLQQKH